MKTFGMERLLALRTEFYYDADDIEAAAIPESMYLPDTVIASILDEYALIKTIDDLDHFIAGAVYVLPNRSRLWQALRQLEPEFVRLRQENKARLAAQCAEKALAASQTVVASGPGDNEQDDEGMDSEGSADIPLAHVQ